MLLLSSIETTFIKLIILFADNQMLLEETENNL